MISGPYFHIYNRGANRAKIFSNEGNYRFLRRRIKRFLPDYGISITAYCFMPNHYHFLMREDICGEKSRFIQRLFNSYTQAYNHQQRRKGTLFEGRMQTKIVEDEAYLLGLIRYIHQNPVRAGLVQNPEEWAFSSHLEWLGTVAYRLCSPKIRNIFFHSRRDYAEFMD